MPLRVEQNIPIMSVFDLKNVTKKWVPSHRLHEVLFGSLVPSNLLHLLRERLVRNRNSVAPTCRMSVRNNATLLLVREMELLDVVLIYIVRVPPLRSTNFGIPKGLNEVLPQILNMGVLLLQLIYRDSIRDGFNQPTSWASSNDIERLEP